MDICKALAPNLNERDRDALTTFCIGGNVDELTIHRIKANVGSMIWLSALQQRDGIIQYRKAEFWRLRATIQANGQLARSLKPLRLR